MANRNRKPRRSRKGSSSQLIWIVASLIGGAVLVVAALAQVARGNDRIGQKACDANVEPEVTGATWIEVLPQDCIDYGDVKLGSTINTVFKVRNTGDQPLVVLGEPQVELVAGC